MLRFTYKFHTFSNIRIGCVLQSKSVNLADWNNGITRVNLVYHQLSNNQSRRKQIVYSTKVANEINRIQWVHNLNAYYAWEMITWFPIAKYISNFFFVPTGLRKLIPIDRLIYDHLIYTKTATTFSCQVIHVTFPDILSNTIMTQIKRMIFESNGCMIFNNKQYQLDYQSLHWQNN